MKWTKREACFVSLVALFFSLLMLVGVLQCIRLHENRSRKSLYPQEVHYQSRKDPTEHMSLTDEDSWPEGGISGILSWSTEETLLGVRKKKRMDVKIRKQRDPLLGML